MKNPRANRPGVPITRERAGVKSRGRAIVAGRIEPQYDAFAVAAAPPRDLPGRDAHAGYAIDRLVLRCWAIGTPVWGADVVHGGRIGKPEYTHMRAKRLTHEFEHTGRGGAPARCEGHGGEPCPATATSVGDGVRRWRYDGADGPADADAPALAEQRLDEVRAELRARGFSDADIEATPSIAQIVKALGEAGESASAAASAAPAGAEPASNGAGDEWEAPRERDPKRRKAIELRAMEEAKRHYREKGWSVEDVSAAESYDLRCTRDGDELHVEVKGTTGAGAEVTLTANEVEHARRRRTALFVLAHIAVKQADGGEPDASGGRPYVLDPWDIGEEGELQPSEYRYRLPGRC